MNTFPNFPLAKAFTLGLGLLITQVPAFAQNDYYNDPAANQPVVVAPAEQPFMATFATYRDDVRQAALRASQQPQVLAQLAKQQSSSQLAFIDLIESYGQTKQGWFYDMARYPDLLHQLATLPGNTDRAAVDELTKAMPANLQTTAWKLYRHHNADLVQVDNLNQQADHAFHNLLAPLDAPTQDAFRQLVGLPDVLTTLTSQLDKTTQLGGQYATDPAGVTRRLTALHDSLTVQQQKELADYQQQLNQDPQARQELQQAGKQYTQANGINPSPAWANPTYGYQNPYSYWSGYPSWYGSPMWYPGLASSTGFYYGLGGNMVVYGLPGYGFSNWFYGGGYGGYYPNLYNRFGTYYGGVVGRPRIWAGRDAGFFGPANRSYGSVTGSGLGRGNGFNQYGGRTYTGPNVWGGGNARVAVPSAGRGSFGGFSGARGSFGGGSFGGGRGSFGGGGFHGGGRR